MAVPNGGSSHGAARRIARPRSIAGSMYTLARSMRIFPTALSPHRRAPRALPRWGVMCSPESARGRLWVMVKV